LGKSDDATPPSNWEEVLSIAGRSVERVDPKNAAQVHSVWQKHGGSRPEAHSSVITLAQTWVDAEPRPQIGQTPPESTKTSNAPPTTLVSTNGSSPLQAPSDEIARPAKSATQDPQIVKGFVDGKVGTKNTKENHSYNQSIASTGQATAALDSQWDTPIEVPKQVSGRSANQSADIPHGPSVRSNLVPDPVIEAKPPLPPTALVREALLAERSGQAEMHIGLRTEVFGSVEVHAVMHDSQVGVAIGLERGDLHHLLANEVPAIEQRLQQDNVRLDTVKFLGQGLTFDAGLSAGTHSQSRTLSQQSTTAPPPLLRGDHGDLPANGDAAVSIEILQERTGLNVRA
jgi:hypothetical protein